MPLLHPLLYDTSENNEFSLWYPLSKSYSAALYNALVDQVISPQQGPHRPISELPSVTRAVFSVLVSYCCSLHIPQIVISNRNF